MNERIVKSDHFHQGIGMRVSIIGAGRNRNGIGEYIGKYFHENGANVTSVLGTTEETSRNASFGLRKYGISCNSYTEFEKMVEEESPDVIVIASPCSSHYKYLTRCIGLGLNVFCEKPFIWQDAGEMVTAVEKILEVAREKRATVAMNSQWPFAVKSYEELCGKIEASRSNRFSISMSPFSQGEEMIPDSVPHVLSILYAFLGKGEIVNLGFEPRCENEMLIRFRYINGPHGCSVTARLVNQKEQPRHLQFGFNGKDVTRSIDLMNYDICFLHGMRRLKIVDPLNLSVRDFIDAVRDKSEPRIGCAHILHNTYLLKKIYDGYEDFVKKGRWKD